ncbi:MAG TPA: hypothetical protein VFY23_15535 [Candidatus Limnocylindrales bacterium]|nr:hypothetical protein [Candidatus Limnocylindrales bacterium]
MSAAAPVAPVRRPVAARPSVSVRRLALLGLAGAALVTGLLGALALLGVIALPGTRLAGSHGLLMTLGFLGTLIALERAVALGQPWGYVAPLASGLAGVGLVVGAPGIVVSGLFLVASVVFLAMYVTFLGVDAELHTWVMTAGALGWTLAAVLLVTGRPVSDAVPALAALLILTIAGERLELSRIRRPSRRAQVVFVGAAAVFAGGVLVAVAAPDLGLRIGGAGMLAMAAWLARHDLARRTVHARGVTRFIAVCLLAGYAWLAIGGLTWLAWGATPPLLARDAMIHALFLGFVISMVFGHAPVILPAVLRVPLPYRPWFYGHVALLHAGLVVRVLVGDVLGFTAAWQLGGVLTVAAMALFVVASASTVLASLLAGRRRVAPA